MKIYKASLVPKWQFRKVVQILWSLSVLLKTIILAASLKSNETVEFVDSATNPSR